MNFRSLTTRAHPLATWTLALPYCCTSPRTTVPIIHNFFCEGVKQPLNSKLIHEGPRLSLSQFMDYALMTVGSAFTVVVADERHTALTRVMAAALELD